MHSLSSLVQSETGHEQTLNKTLTIIFVCEDVDVFTQLNFFYSIEAWMVTLMGTKSER